jgi:hypothetical protein
MNHTEQVQLLEIEKEQAKQGKIEAGEYGKLGGRPKEEEETDTDEKSCSNL